MLNRRKFVGLAILCCVVYVAVWHVALQPSTNIDHSKDRFDQRGRATRPLDEMRRVYMEVASSVSSKSPNVAVILFNSDDSRHVCEALFADTVRTQAPRLSLFHLVPRSSSKDYAPQRCNEARIIYDAIDGDSGSMTNEGLREIFTVTLQTLQSGTVFDHVWFFDGSFTFCKDLVYPLRMRIATALSSNAAFSAIATSAVPHGLLIHTNDLASFVKHFDMHYKDRILGRHIVYEWLRIQSGTVAAEASNDHVASDVSPVVLTMATHPYQYSFGGALVCDAVLDRRFHLPLEKTAELPYFSGSVVISSL